MNGKFMVVAAISAIAIVLYWSPLPINVGEYIIGGYPWLAPEESRPAMMLLGALLAAIFLGLTAFMWFVTKKLEEMQDEEYADVGGGSSPGSEW
ncbi:hypothetical protein [Infirmifilum sp. SLHALR2]|nr:MAG: hypothetical protein B7L53_02155 [Thermofilum sp. NZ13]